MRELFRKRPWDLSQGFLIGGGLIVAGVLLQLILGPVDWHFFAWPRNLLALLALAGVVCAMYALRKRVYAFEWMMHAGAAVPCMAYAVALTIVMGLVPQLNTGGLPWLSRMLRFWPFVLVWLWMMLISSLATLNHLRRFRWKEIPFLLNHLGVVVAIVTATLGYADLQSLEMAVITGETGWEAVDERGNGFKPGPGIELHRFILEEYPNHKPKRYASDITVHTQDGRSFRDTVEVNKPVSADGWKIYQYDYDLMGGGDRSCSVFLLVRDPWIGGVYAGIYMMLAGALCLMLWMAPRPKEKKRYLRVIVFVVLLTAVFLALTLFRSGLKLKELVPALQSPWFAPHVLVYMFAYALLGAATLLALYMLARPGKTTDKELLLTDNLVYVGLAFLTFGMLFGALWAKEAWGTYWTWDPKETWSAITWLCYLLYLHLRRAQPRGWKDAALVLILAFLCLQICWWGIDYLPSAQGLSVHTYGSGTP